MLEEKFGQEFIDCVLGQCKPDCYLCINDNKREEETMPMGKGTYGKTRGRPPKKATPKMMPKKIIKGKKK